ncbi:helix-turn-helix transcriptional regulator [Sporomusa acidovorans]|uniref:Transcriptional regulator DauR n=1 Tax=Sporomusa acidovorans (strain ATCC 49682 / DSM 3132 / Mol) TaxID=1123286 RepID=A0ABZ3JB41_SPOA4|nr:PAS domain-containing protein [Sporomusa acidovorans]OZC21657.1 YheO-like PAS domain protein [Sporomusa acidovorans DSM 3132]SDD60836.1 Predicted transcriptional regulator YheO, contains PAS and DNA-binding HTH domains [Sporomusa acidovorans]
MQPKKLLETYIPLVNFIADIIGPHCEVLLHDVADVQNSVIAIRNGYMSGRQLGCPLTDFGLELLEKKAYLNQNAVVNYLSRTASGEKLRSSTYFIKDENNELIGMLCVNILLSPDSTVVKNLADKLMNALLVNNLPANSAVAEEEKVVESLQSSIENVVDSAIEKIIGQYDMPVERMSSDEKIAIVQNLNANGIFKIKGAITKVASTLQTSESTIYRYLSSK